MDGFISGDGQLDTPDDVIIRSNWNARHHMLDTANTKLDNQLYEVVHVVSGEDKMRIQLKAQEVPVASWLRQHTGMLEQNVDPMEGMQPKTPPRHKRKKEYEDAVKQGRSRDGEQ